MVQRVEVVSPRGFCAGVVRAVETVEKTLVRFGPPVYVRRAIVHNPHVVARLAAAGAVFVQEIDAVPRGGVVVFSAHGVAREVAARAQSAHLTAIDATCPLVAKVHQEVRRFTSELYDVVLIGHAGHDEVVGTLGQAPARIQLVESPRDVERLVVRNSERVACVTQTTLSPTDVAPVIERLESRFPSLVRPRVEDICFATRNRQSAVQWLARQVEVVLVFGDTTSSNSRRLQEVAAAAGAHAYLLGSIEELSVAWLDGVTTVGVASGASTPESVVQSALDFFRRQGAAVHEEVLMKERVFFGAPAGLDVAPAAAVQPPPLGLPTPDATSHRYL